MNESKEIISQLERFRNNVSKYFKSKHDPYGGVSNEQIQQIRATITKESAKIKKYLADANVPTGLAGRAAPVAGGFTYKFNLIDDMFHNEGGPYAVPPDIISDALNRAIGIYEAGDLPDHPPGKAPAPSGPSFINRKRIEELKTLKPENFDLSKLLQILKELNLAFQNECFISVIQLTRALIDHVPPIFTQGNFAQVASNYGGGKSFQASMKHLEDSSRKIADQHLHGQIRKKETLPNETQVNFSNDIDVLLSEIVRILK